MFYRVNKAALEAWNCLWWRWIRNIKDFLWLFFTIYAIIAVKTKLLQKYTKYQIWNDLKAKYLSINIMILLIHNFNMPSTKETKKQKVITIQNYKQLFVVLLRFFPASCALYKKNSKTVTFSVIHIYIYSKIKLYSIDDNDKE